MLRALLLAPPGAGKGTQGERIAEHYGVEHLATGDLLREHVAKDTDLGREATTYMDGGELVPDPLVVRLVLDHIAGPPLLEGFVLDGFPRSLGQAERAHEWGLANDRTFDAVVSLLAPVDELVRRLLERGEQSGRSDDNEETIRNRLAVYEHSTEPLLDYYRERGILLEVDGGGDVDEVTARVVAAIDRAAAADPASRS